MKVGAQIQDSKAKLAAQQQEAGVRMGIDVAKSRAQAAQTKTPKEPT
jgi:type II secretory pathway component PulK